MNARAPAHRTMAQARPGIEAKVTGNGIKALLIPLCALLIFFTESTFRARKFASGPPTIDAQILVQIFFWGLAGLLGAFCGGLSPRNLRGPTMVCAIFLFLMLASVAYSPVPKLTFVSSIGYCAFFTFAVALRRNLSDGKILKGVGLGLAPIVLSAPLLFFAHKQPAESLVGGSNGGRIHGLAEHAAGLGALAALLIIVTVSLFKTQELGRWGRRMWFLIGIGAFVVLGLAFAKTAILALFLSGLLMWWRRSTTVQALAPAWSLLGVAVVAAAAIYGVHALIPDWVEHLLSRGGGSGHDVETLTGRFDIWKTALNQIKRSPFFGHGFDTGRYVIFDRFAKFSALHAHDMYLQCLLYLGLVGFVFLALMIVYLIVGFARRPLLWRDWFGFYVLIWGIAEQGALTNLPSVFTLTWFLALVALRLPPPAAAEPRATGA